MDLYVRPQRFSPMGVARFLSPIRVIAERSTSARTPQTVAAVDLGSNSFHMIVARSLNGELHVLDRLQEMVRLAAGLDERGSIDKLSRARALECLRRFGERLRGMPMGSVRAVGTDTLRRARNGAKFLAAAERALGHPIEIISGQEEARLIYQAVAHDLADDGKPRLVLDIGGGSTEFIIGQKLKTLLAESLHMGCVRFSAEHFPKGRLTRDHWRRALTAAHLELQPIEAAFRARGWSAAYGTSGTIRAVAGVLRAEGWTHGEITLDALLKLRDALLAAGNLAQLDLDGLSPERLPIFPGGLAILTAAFEALAIERMDISDGALREGLLYDLLGRIRNTDARGGTIAALTERYHVDSAQAERVEHTVALCLTQAAEQWRLDEGHAQALSWAARLHEIGLAIAHTKYHRHGAYLAEHSDLPGFSWQEQGLIAALIRGHRRRFPLEVFDLLPKEQQRDAQRLCVLLRLAVLLHRGRAVEALPSFKLDPRKRGLAIRFPRGWLKRNPLTSADLSKEADYLRKIRFALEFS